MDFNMEINSLTLIQMMKVRKIIEEKIKSMDKPEPPKDAIIATEKQVASGKK
jgi:hypothetical protein